MGEQEYITSIWEDRASALSTTDDVCNLTALHHGEAKHEAEVATLKALRGVIHSDADILDLSCGNGRLCKAFFRKVDSYWGTELTDSGTNFLKEWRDRVQADNCYFAQLDLLAPVWPTLPVSTAILLFGTSQFILEDEGLGHIFRNCCRLLAPGGRFIVKQTSSVVPTVDVKVDTWSDTANSRWLANYRGEATMFRLAEAAGLVPTGHFPAYSLQNMAAEVLREVEPYDNTRQMYFIFEKASNV